MKRFTKLFLAMILCLTSLVAFFGLSKAPNKVNAIELADGETLDTVKDEFSISDLTIGGQTDLDMVSSNENTDVSFTKFSENNVNKNLVLKFKYNVVDIVKRDNNNDACFRIHFDVADDKWDVKNSLMFRPDNTFLWSTSKDNWEVKPALVSGLHDVEFGRIAILDSNGATGKYKVYYKIDNEEINAVINEYDLNKMDNTIFFNIGGDNPYNKIYDSEYNLTEEQYEYPAEITLEDFAGAALYYENNKWEEKGYTAKNDQNSRIFKFNVVTKTFGDKSEVQVYANNPALKLWMKNDSGKGTVFFSWELDGKPIDRYYLPENALITSDTTYEVEMGRLRVTTGANKGKDLVYLKVNGEYLLNGDTKSCFYVDATDKPFGTNNIMSVLLTGANLQDGLVDVYEKADEISVSNLKKDGELVGNGVILAGDQTFSYDATAEHKSVVFKFKYEVTALNTTSADDLSCQFHFKNGRIGNSDGGIFWLRDDKNRISKAGSGYVEADAFGELGTYDVELGKLYVVSGANAGKYYLYMSVGGQKVLEYIQPTMPDDACLCTTGSNFNHIYDVEGAPTYEEAKVISVGDLKIGETEVGNVLFVKSHTDLSFDNTDHKTNYSLVFKFQYKVGENKQNQIHISDADNKWGTASAILLNHDGTKVHLGKNSGWTDVNYEMTVGTIYNIEFGRQAIMNGNEFSGKYFMYLKINGAIVSAVEASLDSAVAQGNVLFISTDATKNVFYDEEYVDCAGTHTLGELVAAKAATCTEDGNVAYYQCTNCKETFSDSEATTPVDNVVVAAHHTLGELVAAKAESCTVDGNVAYYQCSVCKKYFSDAEAATEITTNVVIAAHHTLTHHDAVAATCTADGSIEYWGCSVCSKNFKDEACTQEATSTVVAKGHKPTKVAAVAATCEEGGSVEYYRCSVCSKNFSDAACTQQLASVATEATGHTFVKGTCSVCGAEDPNYKGCKSSVALGTFACLAGLAAAFVIRRKREEF